MAKVNGTLAKEVAIYFLDMTQERFTPYMVSKSIVQAKSLLKSGYTVEEIKNVIDYIINNTNVNMYSLGYVSTAINSVLEKIEEEEKFKAVNEIITRSKEEYAATMEGSDEPIVDKSRERNKEKLGRIGIQPRVGEKSYLDLLKE